MNKINVGYKRTRLACYAAYFTMSSIFCVPPLLFVTFRERYGISYTLLGTLVLVNFITQLLVDLVITLFSKKINITKIVGFIPMITSVGLLLYAIIPTAFPSMAYAGLLVGTLVFSLSAGLSETLLSPTIAAIPSDNPQRDMSFLHSLYAFGVFTMVLISTAFLAIFGAEKWMWLIILLALLPLISAALFMGAPMPQFDSAEGGANIKSSRKKSIGLFLCTLCIFFGSCAENAMSNWISGYIENALGVTKAIGDILGVAMFAILLGIGRIGYARFGKNISRVLLIGMLGAVVCYLTAGLAGGVIAPFIACAATGFFTSMLWPGTLILMEEKIEGAGVAAFALMASGGDLGASVAPQLMGIVIDKVAVSEFALSLSEKTGLSPEQIGLKSGMLITSLFPLIGFFIVLIIIRFFKKRDRVK